MPNARPMTGNTNRLTAPSARIAAIAYDASSSSASIAPFAAMIADTPQMEDPIASRLMSLGARRNARPSAVMITIATVSSSTTQRRLTPPSLTTSPSTYAEEDDPDLEPELVSFDAAPEDRRHPDRVRDDQPEDDRPQHVLDIRQRHLMRAAERPDRLL